MERTFASLFDPGWLTRIKCLYEDKISIGFYSNAVDVGGVRSNRCEVNNPIVINESNIGDFSDFATDSVIASNKNGAPCVCFRHLNSIAPLNPDDKP
jgi:hypothetical protein